MSSKNEKNAGTEKQHQKEERNVIEKKEQNEDGGASEAEGTPSPNNQGSQTAVARTVPPLPLEPGAVHMGDDNSGEEEDDLESIASLVETTQEPSRSELPIAAELSTDTVNLLYT